ncbi:MAG: alpha-N-arabinofuranosidase, partial [Clostridiales bacterium]|nr:alpha-N-arabinofuranosidase [Clostridiales bacterium]
QCHKLSGSWNNAHGFMDGISLHYYTLPYDWAKKGAATGFNEKEWYMTLSKTLFMEELVTKHSAIIDLYDPDHKIGLIVDEWGTWYDVEEGTNPGFLYQQNTIRDALVAAINLNIFNKHCDRVKMANIAQLVNVLQAVILTEGDQMVKTPTYYVFNMYKHHQNGTLIESFVDTKTIGLEKDYQVPNLHESVSKDENGKYHITLANLSVSEDYEISADLLDNRVKSAKAEILTGKMDDKNTFDDPDCVKISAFEGVKTEGDKITFTIPKNSVMHIEVEL